VERKKTYFSYFVFLSQQCGKKKHLLLLCLVFTAVWKEKTSSFSLSCFHNTIDKFKYVHNFCKQKNSHNLRSLLFCKKMKRAEYIAKKKKKETTWIRQYDEMFPPLSDTSPPVPEEQKISYMRERSKMRYEDWKARQERKSKENQVFYDQNEKIHVADCESFLGSTWFEQVAKTEFDCQLADILRHEAMERQARADWKTQCDEWEYEQNLKVKKEEEVDDNDSNDDWYEISNRCTMWMKRVEEEKKEKEKRWQEFVEFNAQKSVHNRWNSTNMKKLVKYPSW